MLQPRVTPERIRAVTGKLGVATSDVEYGVRVFTPGCNLSVVIDPQTLRISGVWQGRPRSEDDHYDLVKFAQEVTSRTAVPKCFVTSGGIFAMEQSIYAGEGLTDEQLSRTIRLVFTQIVATAEQVSSAFPQLTGAAQ